VPSDLGLHSLPKRIKSTASGIHMVNPLLHNFAFLDSIPRNAFYDKKENQILKKMYISNVIEKIVRNVAFAHNEKM